MERFEGRKEQTWRKSIRKLSAGARNVEARAKRALNFLVENNEGRLFELITSDLGLHQLISEPTHLMGNSKSCIFFLYH